VEIKMVRDFLGKGWKFPVNSDPNGKIRMSEYEEDIKEAIWIILTTSKGERLMRPTFVFEHLSITTIKMMEDTVEEALILWEPRIKVINVQASTEKVDEGKIIISVDYLVRSTNNQFNLVYPFYLMEGG
jgi:hypothetical protein